MILHSHQDQIPASLTDDLTLTPGPDPTGLIDDLTLTPGPDPTGLIDDLTLTPGPDPDRSHRGSYTHTRIGSQPVSRVILH
ncbi:hypothetical protein NDU88_008007 [Pleurodeles waltl]|uniref:Uncharacterized protein n=1 Tax=Pleurodeles waltl TaxID=8319 RepID=A0AAV7N7J2_PLEWA|nr:hypothetical protein NDU88_008007 [Pleurodeles waltl]